MLVLINICDQTKHFLWGVPDQNRFDQFLHTIRLIGQIVNSPRRSLQMPFSILCHGHATQKSKGPGKSGLIAENKKAAFDYFLKSGTSAAWC